MSCFIWLPNTGLTVLWIQKFLHDLYIVNFYFSNYSRVLEFASQYWINYNSYLKICVNNISENFEFMRQRIREY